MKTQSHHKILLEFQSLLVQTFGMIQQLMNLIVTDHIFINLRP